LALDLPSTSLGFASCRLIAHWLLHDNLSLAPTKIFPLLGPISVIDHGVTLLLLLAKSLAQLVHRPVLLGLVQLRMLLHQEDARAGLLYRDYRWGLTGVVGMLHELRVPGVRDGDALTLGVVVLDLEALVRGLGDDVLHVLLPHGAQHPEEELPLRKLVGQLLVSGQVLYQHGVLEGVVVEVLHGELLVSRDLQADDLVLLEVQLIVGKNVSHEAELGALHRRKEHVHYGNVRMIWQLLPCWVM